MEKFRSTTNCQPAEGEELMPEKEAGPVDEEIEPELNTELLNMVTQMGIAETPAKHALICKMSNKCIDCNRYITAGSEMAYS